MVRRSRKRAGGRDARRALRAAGVRGQAVQPGMAGGAYRPLSDRDIERIHATGLVHLDLRSNKNVLVRDDGQVVLCDFASALCFRPGGLLHRLVFRWLAANDLSGWVMLPVAMMMLAAVLRTIRWLEFPVMSYRLVRQ